MLDAMARRVVAPPLTFMAHHLQGTVTPNQVTLSGFVVGLAAVPCIVFEWYWLGLICIAINRLFDGIDGTLARKLYGSQGSHWGGFLDIVCDFIFYAAIAAAFGLAQPHNAWVSFLLLVSFAGTGSSFLVYAIMAQKLGISQAPKQHKSFHYLGGLTEGTETIAFFVLCCLFPQWFWLFGLVFSAMCVVTIISRIWQAKLSFSWDSKPAYSKSRVEPWP